MSSSVSSSQDMEERLAALEARIEDCEARLRQSNRARDRHMVLSAGFNDNARACMDEIARARAAFNRERAQVKGVRDSLLARGYGAFPEFAQLRTVFQSLTNQMRYFDNIEQMLSADRAGTLDDARQYVRSRYTQEGTGQEDDN